MKKVTLAVAMAILLFFVAGEAVAVPTVDGVNTGAEWTTGLYVNSFDPNEVGAGILNIPDNYDISRIAMILEDDGLGGDDGLYVLIELYGTPTFTTIGPNPVIYSTQIDTNGDGDFLDADDRKFDFRLATGFTVYDGTGAVVTDTTSAAMMSSAVEYYVPFDMLIEPYGDGPQFFTLLDNGGSPADDNVPDEGFDRPIPEPTTMALFGSGLLGALGYARRKRNVS